MNTWDPDIQIDLASIGQIIQSRFQQFTSFQPLGQGWDNVAVIADDSYVFRLPHRQQGAECVINEIAALPSINSALKIPTPDIQFIGEPGPDYPYQFIGYPILPGNTADSTTWSALERRQLIEPLATALKTLHSIQTPDLPGDVLHRKDPAALLRRITDRLEQIPDNHIPMKKDALINWAKETSEQVHPSQSTALVHGDLYPRHILVDHKKRLTGIIDWGDVHRGHPAIDLSIAFTFVPPNGRQEFFEIYGSTSDDDKLLAKLRACMYGCALLHYGIALPDRDSERMGTNILAELELLKSP